ncbi:hypothetical protein KIH27_18120 [Mycobacterium sp. M1]|uniref:Uncharacterized protein n=1 Tax=Mycolicibacter acidiphilus TaxID=2835306 RepID=A0ABS5RMI5_9MYCO|nr:hypothetical protein [Mycolicibacter acidiphilus]MBS9535505.1 hypothetical protein [Mycolicibacter acidiphilus]
MSGRGRESGAGGGFFAVFLLLALLWWLRWVILAGLVMTALWFAVRWLVRRQRQHRAAEHDRIDAIRRRAITENYQVLHGDPAGFFGQYPLPDPDLIPRWYRSG